MTITNSSDMFKDILYCKNVLRTATQQSKLTGLESFAVQHALERLGVPDDTPLEVALEGANSLQRSFMESVFNQVNRFFSFRKTNQTRDIRQLLINAKKNNRTHVDKELLLNTDIWSGHSKKNISNEVNGKVIKQYFARIDKLMDGVDASLGLYRGQLSEFRKLTTDAVAGRVDVDGFKSLLDSDKYFFPCMEAVGGKLVKHSDEYDYKIYDYFPHSGYGPDSTLYTSTQKLTTYNADIDAASISVLGIKDPVVSFAFDNPKQRTWADRSKVSATCLTEKEIDDCLDDIDRVESLIVALSKTVEKYDDLIYVQYDAVVDQYGRMAPTQLKDHYLLIADEVISLQRFYVVMLCYHVLQNIDSFMYAVRDLIVASLEEYE